MRTIVLFGFVLGALSAAGKVFVTKPGLTVTLECGVGSYSRSLEWKHENTLILSQFSSGFPRKGNSDLVKRSTVRQTNLRITEVKEEDAGKFTCAVDGNSQDVTLVVVSVRASPSTDLQLGNEVTLQCRVSGLSPGPSLQWIRPDGGQDLKGEEVPLKPVTRSHGGTWTCTFSHADGTHRESLEIRVKEPPITTAPAPVPPGKPKDGHKETCTNCDTKSPPKADLVLGLSWWMWVIVGVGCLVVVLLLVVVICLYKRIKRKKRKLQKMKNSRLPLTTKQYCQCNRPTAAAKPQQGRRREKPSAPPLQPLLME